MKQYYVSRRIVTYENCIVTCDSINRVREIIEDDECKSNEKLDILYEYDGDYEVDGIIVEKTKE